MESQPITFTAEGVTCEGVVVRPDTHGQTPGVVICHPHPLRGGDMMNNVVVALAEAFAEVGFAVLRFNFRGVGRSTGHYAEGVGEQEDAKAALAWLSAQPGIDADRLFLGRVFLRGSGDTRSGLDRFACVWFRRRRTTHSARRLAISGICSRT